MIRFFFSPHSIRQRGFVLSQVLGQWSLALLLGTTLTVNGISWGQSAQEGVRVDAVEFSGLERVAPEAIRELVDLSPGLVSRAAISEGVKTLYRSGYFDQVIARISSGRESHLVFDLQEKPIVRKLLVQGNSEVDDDQIDEIIEIERGSFLNLVLARSMANRLAGYYQSQGYYDAKVKTSTKSASRNQVDLIFKIQEGERYRILDIRIEGLREVAESEVLGVMQTRRYKWWNSWLLGTGRLSREMVEIDRSLIRQYLLNNGFVEADVSEPRIKKVESGLEIVFFVSEGVKYRIGGINLEERDGATGRDKGRLVTREELLETVDSESGEIFSAATVREDAFKLGDKFGDRGYAFANVVPETSVDPGKKLVNLKFVVDKGEQVWVDRILIRGNDKTYENVVRRSFELNEQELYSSSKLKRTEELLKRLGYFEEVTLTTEPTLDPNKVNLLASVKEGPTGSFSIGAGFSTTDGALLNARVTERNLLGTGRQLTLNFDIGARRNNLILSFYDPRVDDSFVSAGVDFQRTEREFTDFSRTLSGGGFSIGYPLEQIFGAWAQDINFSTRYELLDIDIFDVVEGQAADLVLESQGRSVSSALAPSLTLSTIDNPLNPTKGARRNLTVEFAGLGGDQEYLMVQASNSWFKPLFDISKSPVVFSWRTRLGYGDSLNDDPFPLFKRFFPGGIDSVRGFQNRTLGPVDSNGNEFGGSKEFVNNLELIFPLVTDAGVKGVVFFDSGEAFNDEQSIKVGDLRHAYGLGIRWFSPMGPIRIEFGIPIDRESGEDSVVTNFSFGAPL